MVKAKETRPLADQCRTIYFHGLPGAPIELAWALSGHGSPETITAPDRLKLSRGEPFEAAMEQLIAMLQEQGATQKLHLVGFSLGTKPALQVAAALGDRVARVDLISCAAPLELGSFLEGMAGKPVFETARDHPRRFKALCFAQSVMAKYFPGVLYSALFASGQGGDLALKKDPDFREMIVAVLRHSLAVNLDSYQREVRAFVTPWAGILKNVSAPVTCWHGDQDTWSPFAMATALAEALPGQFKVNCLEGCAHYSALQLALPKILQHAQSEALGRFA